MPALWVVKLGGSFYAGDTLPQWLAALARGPRVIVPGGGPFADAVRAAQQRWRFSDATAHAMAVTAMGQFGRMLQGLCPDLLICRRVQDIDPALSDGRAVVWVPELDELRGPAIVESWTMTSDSLAAWLAGVLDAGQLLLVKSAPVPAGTLSVPAAVMAGLVDAALPRVLAGSTRPAWLCSAEQHDRLAAGLRVPDQVFTRLMPDAMSQP